MSLPIVMGVFSCSLVACRAKSLAAYVPHQKVLTEYFSNIRSAVSSTICFHFGLHN